MGKASLRCDTYDDAWMRSPEKSDRFDKNHRGKSKGTSERKARLEERTLADLWEFEPSLVYIVTPSPKI